jgi:hypothetical protein
MKVSIGRKLPVGAQHCCAPISKVADARRYWRLYFAA